MACGTKNQNHLKFCTRCGEPFEEQLKQKGILVGRKRHARDSTPMPKWLIYTSSGLFLALAIMVTVTVGVYFKSELLTGKAQEIANIHEQLDTIPKSDYMTRAQLYDRLVQLDPYNKKYKKIADYLKKKAQRHFGDGSVGRYSGFATFDNEMAYVSQIFGCTSFALNGGGASGGAVFECSYAQKRNIVWALYESNQKDTISHAVLSWVSEADYQGEPVSMFSDPDVEAAIRAFSNRYAKRQRDAVQFAFESQESRQIMSGAYLLNYSFSRSGKRIERSLKVTPRN